jgi:hypothetical protein
VFGSTACASNLLFFSACAAAALALSFVAQCVGNGRGAGDQSGLCDQYRLISGYYRGSPRDDHANGELSVDEQPRRPDRRWHSDHCTPSEGAPRPQRILRARRVRSAELERHRRSRGVGRPGNGISVVTADTPSYTDFLSGNSCDDGLCPSDGRRRFYLTRGGFIAFLATTASACARGFHFASLWEIRDPRQLFYDSTLGRTGADLSCSV